MDNVKKAQENMAARKANCAQSMLTAFSEDFGLNIDTAYSIAQGFGGGMHINSVCGAVTGAYMVLGLANPISKDNPRQSMEKVNALQAEFNRKFKELHDSLNCTGLLGYDVSIPEQAKEAREAGVITTKCPDFVRDAAKIVDNLIKKT
jgi:C_GCAxxG_C_C family probable redox protein